ncbi:hypothetical protein [Desulfonatronovibrio magnus]|uniref:hypothetical protein n=1 Tax=Desulfonatronovibrio magnus TaxID=698827 RepID=UPI0005EBC9A2|nr:hypothetical protein [Desulfonatronovibrio magnus]
MFEEIWLQFYEWLDTLLIAPFRAFEIPIVGFYFGTFILCLWCILLGELTFRVAAVVNRSYMNKLRAQAVKMHNLSIKAIVVKDKENFRACNKEANEAFGKYFFNMITQGAAFLWPVPFALGWMSTRFSGLEFEMAVTLPLIGDTVGFAAVLIPMYILCRIFWGRLKPHLYFFKNDPRVGIDEGEEEMIKWEDINKHRGLPERFWQNQDGPESVRR